MPGAALATELPPDRNGAVEESFHTSLFRQEAYPPLNTVCRAQLVFCYPMSATPENRPPLKILIVEDNRDVRTTLRMLLSLSYGHVVCEAADGASGIQVALEEKPDVALIDLGLPDVEGHEVARRIRASLHGQSIMLIALTGYGDAEDMRRTQEAGFDLHLVKPVDMAALAQIFERRLRGRANGVSSPGSGRKEGA